MSLVSVREGGRFFMHVRVVVVVVLADRAEEGGPDGVVMLSDYDDIIVSTLERFDSSCSQKLLNAIVLCTSVLLCDDRIAFLPFFDWLVSLRRCSCEVPYFRRGGWRPKKALKKKKIRRDRRRRKLCSQRAMLLCRGSLLYSLPPIDQGVGT